MQQNIFKSKQYLIGKFQRRKYFYEKLNNKHLRNNVQNQLIKSRHDGKKVIHKILIDRHDNCQSI